MSPEEKLALAEERLQQADERFRQAEELMLQAQEILARTQARDEEAQRLAYVDQLTGLPNLNHVRQVLDFNLKQAHRYERTSALLSIDLDRFRIINEALGFKTGDELLVLVAERLQGIVRESDLLARRGEDEFLLLLSELHESSQAELVARRVLELLHDEPFVVQGQPLHVGASLGISLCPDDAKSTQEMLEHADASLYCAKEQGRGRFQVYSEGLQQQLRRRLVVENCLFEALERSELSLLYHPIVDLTSREVVGVEALLRWTHPELGEVSPGEFLPVAEESALIVPIGDWVLRESCRQLKAWKELGLDMFIDVNLSRRQLLHADMASAFLRVLEEAQLDGRDIVVDVSEDHYTSDPRVRSVLADLGLGGVRIAIDDFGTGLSSLKTIRLSQTKILKLDSTFVAGIPGNRQYLSICVAVIRLAESLNMRSLAEGIENEKQFEYLRKNECHLGQGFYFCQPMPAEQVAEGARRGL